MRIVTIPLNQDNYGYLLIDESTNECAVVDVSGQPAKVAEVLKEEGVKVSFIFTTHKHADHAGGNTEFKEIYPNVKILGSEVDNVEGCDKFVVDGEEFLFGSLKVRCILTPGHTMGHVSYYVEDGNRRAVFTGDCLFIGGAGRFFEGTGSDMYVSLYQKLMSLPQDTEIYCGHEYTLANYKFALSVDPKNIKLIEACCSATALREKRIPTVPSTILQEMETNPFLRVDQPSIQMLCGNCSTDPIVVLTGVREAKNAF
jgi:hydroxyacylglutathione hydrolase